MFKQRQQYYFQISDDERFEPNFPKEYDKLCIEYRDNKWYVERNKLIDRFIRKSKKVYCKIGETKNCFVLRFLLEGKEIFVIPYDDIGYPESAIRIMNDIMQNTIGFNPAISGK